MIYILKHLNNNIMKRLLISICTLLFLGGNVIAQQKTKTKEDKTKMKDKDADIKIKEKEGKYKEKEGDNKTKMKEDDMKMKEGDMKMNEGDMKMKEDDMKNTDSASMSSSSYTADYSSNFVMGNPAYSTMILDMWKDWDDNAIDRHDYWADSMTVFLPDGMVIKGKQANLEGAKKYRGGMKSVKSTLHAWVPLKSTDRNEDLVAVWGQEVDTYPDGKVETTELHEVYAFNKDGKITWMRQYSAKPPSSPMPANPTVPAPPQ